VEDLIYDGYDDITRGLVNYALYDDSCQTVLSYITKIDLGPLGIAEDQEIGWKVWSMDGVIYVTIDAEGTVELITISGEIVDTFQLQHGENKISTKFQQGLFF
jgi:hypothetical protein